MGDVVDRYLPYAERRLKASTYSGVVLHLRKHWQPLHLYEIQSLERRHVAAQLSRIAENSGPYGANRSRAALSALFAWAIGEGLADSNPVVGTNKATDEVVRDRVLEDRELRLVWLHAGGGQYSVIVRLLILFGQRPRKSPRCVGVNWISINGYGGLLPSARKMDCRTTFLLPDPALDLLAAQRKHPGRDLVFGEGAARFKAGQTRRAGSTLDCGTDRMTAPWRLHDLRRTAATRMADLGVQPHVIEAVLNHVSGHKAGVAGVYNRSSYAIEKSAALTKWAAHVMALANGR